MISGGFEGEQERPTVTRTGALDSRQAAVLRL